MEPGMRRLQCKGAGPSRAGRAIGLRITALAPVAQRIEHRPPEPVAQVRVLPGAQKIEGVISSPCWILRSPKNVSYRLSYEFPSALCAVWRRRRHLDRA
jgi:hypothetical protein